MFRAEVKLDPEVIKMIVERHYGLQVQSVQQVRAIYKINTSAGSYGFKNAEELPDLPLIANYLQRIRQNGFERTPGIVPSRQGEFLVPHNDESFFMEKWLDYPEVPKESFALLPNIGRALADFHHSAKGIIPSWESPRFDWGKRREFLLSAFDKISQWKQRPSRTPVENEILDFLHYRCYLALDYIKRVSPPLLLRTCPDAAVLCHGGLHHKNILVDRQNRIWFIDFETMVYAERVMDLAQFLQYHASPYRWNPDVASAFLTAYCSRLRMPIRPDEWSMLLSYLAFPRRFHNRMIRYFDDRERPPEFLLKLQETMHQDLDKEYFLSQFRWAAV